MSSSAKRLGGASVQHTQEWFQEACIKVSHQKKNFDTTWTWPKIKGAWAAKSLVSLTHPQAEIPNHRGSKLHKWLAQTREVHLQASPAPQQENFKHHNHMPCIRWYPHPQGKLAWQCKIHPFQDVFPIENMDFPLLCWFSGVELRSGKAESDFRPFLFLAVALKSPLL